MAIVLLPDLGDFCRPLQTGPGELCIQLPGGAVVCASDLESGDAAQIVKGLLAQLNTALAPLAPFFNLLEFVQAVMACISAIPKAIGGNLPALVDATVDLAKAVDKLVKLIPQLSVPVMIVSSMNVIVQGLIGIRAKLAAIIRHVQRVDLAEATAASTGNAQLAIVASCARDNLEAQMANVNAGFAPLNRLIGLLNAFLELIGLPCIPTVGGIPSAGEDGLDALDATIAILQAITATIPATISLPDLPAPGEC